MIGESKQIIDENPIGEREKQKGITGDRKTDPRKTETT